MNLEFDAHEIEFRDEVRAFIDEAFDSEMRAMMIQSKNGYLDREGQVRWQRRLYERGWIAPDWPQEHGGPGWTATQRYIFQREIAAAGCPQVVPMGLKMVAHVIIKFGSAEQKARFLPPILRSDAWWCQGYSEPGSGSDLASLQVRSKREGDHYVVSGSKTWTTHAQWADWIFCLVRTSREVRRQEGISFLLVDMKSPGITVKPLPLLDGPLEGQQEVNQVFFDEVRVPVENRIGEEGEGWTYAKYLLQFERGGAWGPGLQNWLDKVRRIAEQERGDDGCRLIDDPDFRRRLAELQIRVEAVDATELRILSNMVSGQPPGAISSMLKLAGSEARQAISELAMEACGVYARPFVRDTWAEIKGREVGPRPGPEYAAAVAPKYFNARKASVFGGTNEIQRNILAKQVLKV